MFYQYTQESTIVHDVNQYKGLGIGLIIKSENNKLIKINLSDVIEFDVD